jgi:hypothetical protein
MIEEAYVSFEIAKLLKENGFNERVMKWYVIEDDGSISKVASHSCSLSRNSSFENGEIGMPTQQMAMRWLREEYRIAVSPIPYRYPSKWDCMIVYLGEPMEKDDKYDICLLKMIRSSYEEAAEAGIQHVLKNIVAEIRKKLINENED